MAPPLGIVSVWAMDHSHTYWFFFSLKVLFASMLDHLGCSFHPVAPTILSGHIPARVMGPCTVKSMWLCCVLPWAQ